jgi:ketosteroid isomerase-like protein
MSGPGAVFAQAGVPGSRLENGSDHRAAVRAEAYRSVAKFLAEWREAWNGNDSQALARLYTDDATLRLPGQQIVQDKASIDSTAQAAVRSAARLSMIDLDFDSDGQRSILVSRYVLQREGHLVEGIMTAVMYAHRSSWRLRVHTFDAPEQASTSPGAASEFTPLVVRDSSRAGRAPTAAPEPAPLRPRYYRQRVFGRPGLSAPELRAAVRAAAYDHVVSFLAEWRAAWNGGDAEALARLYTEDAALRLPGQGIVQGNEQIGTSVRTIATGAARLSMVDLDFDGYADWSVLVARYVLSREGNLVEGVMTAIIYGERSGLRLRAHIFHAPERIAADPGSR